MDSDTQFSESHGVRIVRKDIDTKDCLRVVIMDDLSPMITDGKSVVNVVHDEENRQFLITVSFSGLS